MNIENSINSILARGTQIVSFNYHGKERNVLIGDNRVLGQPTWGTQVNRAIREYKGEKYLVALEANVGPTTKDRQFKCFKLSEISNPSFA